MKYLFLILTISLSSTLFGQSIEQRKMAKLSFLIGDWKGTGTSYPKEENEPYQVLTKTRYDLDGELIVLKLRDTRNGKPVLSLHTLFYYDHKQQTYLYSPFSGKSSGTYKCKIIDGKFICALKSDYRLIFKKSENGELIETGEKLEGGKWIKSFEDILLPTEEIRF